MRKLAAALFVTLDGVIESPEQWQAPYFDEEMGAVIGESMTRADAFLLGRRTYEEWAAYWPTPAAAGNPVAPAVNALPKYVASTSLDEVEWQNSSLLEGETIEAVFALKEREGRDILISGSGTLVRSLIEVELVDELRLLVHPVLVGSGGRLFEGGAAPAPFELAGSSTLGSGVLNLTYAAA